MSKLFKNLKRGMSVVLTMCFCLAISMTVFAEADLHAGAGDILHSDVDLMTEEELAEYQASLIEVVMANVKDSLNVRAEADEEADTVGKLYKNCGGIILERKDGWTYLESGELKGWAKDEYLFFGKRLRRFSRK